jgi:hypothetical protein
MIIVLEYIAKVYVISLGYNIFGLNVIKPLEYIIS